MFNARAWKSQATKWQSRKYYHALGSTGFPVQKWVLFISTEYDFPRTRFFVFFQHLNFNVIHFHLHHVCCFISFDLTRQKLQFSRSILLDVCHSFRWLAFFMFCYRQNYWQVCELSKFQITFLGEFLKGGIFCFSMSDVEFWGRNVSGGS